MVNTVDLRRNEMKKIITVFLAIAIALSTVIFVTSCGDSDEDKSAKDSLSSNERFVYDVITEELSSFKDPASVKIDSIYQHTDYSVMVKISGKNSYGGSVSDEYLIFTKDAYLSSGTKIAGSGHMESFDDMCTRLGKSYNGKDFSELYTFMTKTSPTTNISYNVALLNEAINDYKVLRGWS